MATFTQETYKDFTIEKWGGNKWLIRNLNGEPLRICKTKADCKRRINTQTV